MPRDFTFISAAAVSDCHAWLRQWQEPPTFSATASALFKRLTWKEKFNVPALAFLRDAWTLGKFATLAGADKVRLNEDNFPDGFVMIGGKPRSVEVTEVLMPGRHRGQEFLPGTPQVRDDPADEWDRRIDALPRALADTIQRKVQKTYAASPTLVVYLNIGAYGHREAECRAAIAHSIDDSARHFAGLYVIWSDELFGRDGG